MERGGDDVDWHVHEQTCLSEEWGLISAVLSQESSEALKLLNKPSDYRAFRPKLCSLTFILFYLAAALSNIPQSQLPAA